MDSFGLHFERMSNFDLHPLSLPISRLSPAKSNSSITDQLTHHQHGKGDSAYSSFSGGSTVPDYPSPFLQDDLQPSSFNHYSDLKYVKAVYQPCQVHQSETRTMDQLYHSVEQHRNINTQRQNGHDRCNSDGKATASQNPPRSYQPPPPPPARLDSFVATRNRENNRGYHQDTKPQPQQLRTHKQQMPFSHFHSQTQDALKSNQTSVPEPGNSSPVYGGWQETQEQPPQLPSYRPPPQHHDVVNFSNSEHIFPANQSKLGQQQMSAAIILSKPRPQSTNQVENQKNRQRARSSGGDVSNKGGNHFDRHRRRAHSTKESAQSLGPEPSRSSSPSSIGQNLTASNSQLKGQFYFVTGKQTGTGGRKLSVSSCASEAGSESSTVVETFSLTEQERCHSTMDNFFMPPQHRQYKSTEALSDKQMQVYNSMSQEQDSVLKNQDENLSTMFNGPSPMTIQPSHSFESLEQMHLIQSQDIGRHTANHPIFFCGPEENYAHQGNQRPTKKPTTMSSNDQLSSCKREDLAKKSRRQPLGDVASERINKETTPILYHLTGANRVTLKPKKDVITGIKGEETIFNKASHKDMTHSKERPLQIETVAEVGGEVLSNASNTLDDSFMKYYKEQLKDAQSKVLRETSFKRKDLQLSWPHRIKEQRPEPRPTVMHHFSASQDSETSTETLTPSVASEEMETGSIKKMVLVKEERDEEGQQENGRPPKVAQPQVARIGGRKRLTQEQKKMCFSEPEKLHQLGDSPNHSACRSLGNELEFFITTECNGEDRGQHDGEQGFVASRRKMFEMRGRTLSASSLSKTNLKNLQHKALVEYMERKTGHKVAEPQQPGPQVLPPPRQRHSIGEKPVGWAAKSQTVSTPSQGSRKKLNRPHSAGRILDSSSSSIRYREKKKKKVFTVMIVMDFID